VARFEGIRSVACSTFVAFNALAHAASGAVLASPLLVLVLLLLPLLLASVHGAAVSNAQPVSCLFF
jgi:hypothetical protein